MIIIRYRGLVSRFQAAEVVGLAPGSLSQARRGGSLRCKPGPPAGAGVPDAQDTPGGGGGEGVPLRGGPGREGPGGAGRWGLALGRAREAR